MVKGIDFTKAQRNLDLINNEDFDDFDKLVVIQGWFENFSTKQQENLISILQGKVYQ